MIQKYTIKCVNSLQVIKRIAYWRSIRKLYLKFVPMSDNTMIEDSYNRGSDNLM